MISRHSLMSPRIVYYFVNNMDIKCNNNIENPVREERPNYIIFLIILIKPSLIET